MCLQSILCFKVGRRYAQPIGILNFAAVRAASYFVVLPAGTAEQTAMFSVTSSSQVRAENIVSTGTQECFQEYFCVVGTFPTLNS